MTHPLALVCYEQLLQGSQLINRLQDLGYRVKSLTDYAALAVEAAQERALVIVVDLTAQKADPCRAIGEVRKTSTTSHIPILAVTDREHSTRQGAATAAGATLVALDDAILPQLPQLLEQLLQVD